MAEKVGCIGPFGFYFKGDRLLSKIKMGFNKQECFWV